jgi:phosphoribosyl-AMP cyclohydrolase
MVEGTLIASTLRVKIVQSSAAHSTLQSLLKWNPEGLVPAIVQDAESGEVLMLAWMNGLALARTLETGQTHFYSRSRRSLWHKGGTSGHVQLVESIRVDCDADVLLIKVRQKGGACHEGYRSCFFRRVDEAHGLEIVDRPVFDAERVYSSGHEASGDDAPASETA